MCLADPTSDIRNAWEVHFSSGRSLMVHDTNDVIHLTVNGEVIKVIHVVIAWRPFGDHPIGKHISRSDVTDYFVR